MSTIAWVFMGVSWAIIIGVAALSLNSIIKNKS